jgi:zinc transport system permease protein
MILLLSAIILVVIFKHYKKLMYIAFDEDQARVSGMDATKLSYLFIVLASLAIIVSVRLVGVLLISSLIVIPNISAMMFGKGFKKTMCLSISIATASVISGIVTSFVFNLAPGGTIVISSIAILLGIICTKFIPKQIRQPKKEVTSLKMAK